MTTISFPDYLALGGNSTQRQTWTPTVRGSANLSGTPTFQNGWYKRFDDLIIASVTIGGMTLTTGGGAGSSSGPNTYIRLTVPVPTTGTGDPICGSGGFIQAGGDYQGGAVVKWDNNNDEFGIAMNPDSIWSNGTSLVAITVNLQYFIL